MKLFRILLCILLFSFVFLSYTVAQQRTFYYKQESYYDTVDKKENASIGHGEFYTITPSKAYVSDEDGNEIGKVPYLYRGKTDDGNMWYCQTFCGKWQDQFSLVIAPDYSVLNCRVGHMVFVYVRSTPPARKPADPHLLR